MDKKQTTISTTNGRNFEMTFMIGSCLFYV